jgi:hypothetical protein
MLEGELAGGTVLLQGAVGLTHAYDLYRADASGVGNGEPIAKVIRGTRIAGYGGLHVSAGDERILDVGRPNLSVSPRAVHPVISGDDRALGSFQRESLTHLRYRIDDAEGAELATAERRSPPLGGIRGVLNHFFLEWIPLPFRFAFLADGSEVGSFRRVARVRRRYVLDLSGDPGGKIDPRLFLALAIDLAERDAEG